MSTKKSDQLPHFCARPFVLANITPDGHFSPCCRIPRGFGNVKETPLSQLWHSKKMNQLRQEFLQGERPSTCQECWDHEDRGLHSERLSSGNISLMKEFRESIIEDKNHELRSLEIRPSNSCNFVCRMCNPDISSAWYQKNQQIELYPIDGEKTLKAYSSGEKLIEEIAPYFENLRYLKIHGGEPLFESQVLDLFYAVAPHKKNIELRWITNLSVTNHPIYDERLLNGWKRVFTTVSLDGPPDVCEYIRVGHKTENFEKNLEKLREQETRIVFHIALQALNISHIPSFCDYLIALDAQRVTFNKVEYPSTLSVSILPNEIKERALKELDQYEKVLPQKEISESLQRDLEKLLKETRALLQESNPDQSLKKWREFIDWNHRFDGSLERLYSINPSWAEIQG